MQGAEPARPPCSHLRALAARLARATNPETAARAVAQPPRHPR
eukprot:COSAG01_NODE_900_length_12865_cov_90.056870_6_plen_43_part_00